MNPSSTKYTIQKHATQKVGDKETRIRPESLYRAIRELKEMGAIEVSNVGISRFNMKMEYYSLKFRGVILALQSLYSSSYSQVSIGDIPAEYRAMFPGILNQWNHFKSHGPKAERCAISQFKYAILDEPTSADIFDPTQRRWLPSVHRVHEDELTAVFRRFIFGRNDAPDRTNGWEEPWISSIKDSKVLLGWAQKLAFANFSHYYQICEKWADTLKELEPLPDTLTQETVEMSVVDMLRDLRKIAKRYRIAKRQHYIT